MKFEQGLVCIHLLEKQHTTAYRHFTGKGLNYNLLCKDCAENPEQHRESLREVDAETFVDKNGDVEILVGSPEVLQRPSNLFFEHHKLEWLSFGEATPLAFHPRGEFWLCCLDTGAILEIDLKTQSQKQICHIYDYQLKLSDSVLLRVSPDNRFIALANRLGQFGIVWDSLKHRITLRLDRGSYRFQNSSFPLAFFEIEGKSYLAHGRDWNRLDITEPEYGRIISQRPSPKYERGVKVPHYLDYFHSRLYISPDNQWIAEDGWVWHPFGIPKAWNLHRWFHENVWESEDGSSIQAFWNRGYFWDGPMVWLDAKTLGIWGYGEDDLSLADILLLYDVTTNDAPTYISGVKKGELIFDSYLFCIAASGTEVWDRATEERLYQNSEFKPSAYNPNTKEFLSVLPNKSIQISYLREG
jgi:hypothetical protein